MPIASLQTRPGAAPSAGRRIGLAVGLAEVALVILIGALAARLIWSVVYGGSAYDLTIEGAGARAADRIAPPVDLSRLTEVEFFADRRAEPVAVESRVELAPETQLNLTLKGVRRGLNAESGSAIVQLPDGSERVFLAGREVIDGVTLEEVHVGYVVLNRRGVRETLSLRDRDRLQAAAAAPDRAASSSIEIFGVSLAAQTRGGELLGYALPADPPPLARALGLRGGDVVTAINGRRLATVENMSELLEDLEEADSVTLAVLRGGRQVSVPVDIP
jgi:type II secretion system protein C